MFENPTQPRADTAAAQSLRLALGMPHLDPGGLSREWLMRECCHLHWWHIAGQFGVRPSELTDASGARALPSVIGCRLEGEPADYAEDDAISLTMVKGPSADNNWCSRSVLVSGTGKALTLDLMTAFIRRDGASNRALARTRVTGDEQPSDPEPSEAVGKRFQTSARALKARATQQDQAPHLSIRIDAAKHYNGVRLTYFAQFAGFFAAAERNALPVLPDSCVRDSSTWHWYGNIDAGDHLEIWSGLEIQRLAPHALFIVRSTARRRLDGALVAMCESRFRS